MHTTAGVARIEATGDELAIVNWLAPIDGIELGRILAWDGETAFFSGLRRPGNGRVEPVVVERFGSFLSETEIYPLPSRANAMASTEDGYVFATQVGLHLIQPPCRD